MDASTAAVMDRPADDATAARSAVILRTIARGGFAGVVVGLIVGGIGGRIVMRLAALAVPGSAGAVTENGNRIGDITLAGTLGLSVLGLFAGLVAATIWVAVSPWIPGLGLRRAVLAMPIAVALGAPGLIDGDNPDFSVLGHDPFVVAMLIVLVAIFGFLFAVVDQWLDRRLPIATGRAKTLYAIAASLGIGFGLLVLTAFLSSPEPMTVLTGVALIGVAVATLRLWVVRVAVEVPSSRLILAGRVALAVAVVLGSLRLVPQVSRALGMLV
jgi:hypothetical protein